RGADDDRSNSCAGTSSEERAGEIVDARRSRPARVPEAPRRGAGGVEEIEMNPQKLMKQVAQMQEQMQRKMQELRVEGSAGGGMVKATMNGSKELLAVAIDKEAVDPNDVEMLQDLVVAAVNEAARKVDEEMQSSLG